MILPNPTKSLFPCRAPPHTPRGVVVRQLHASPCRTSAEPGFGRFGKPSWTDKCPICPLSGGGTLSTNQQDLSKIGRQMAILSNSRHEAFARGLADGRTIDAAY